MTNLQSLNSNRIFDNKLAVTSGNGSSFNTGLFTESRRTGGAECFPKKNTAPVCVDYASTTNRGLWCSVHRLQEPAPNCRSLLRDGGQPRILKTPLTAEELAPIGLLSELVQQIRKREWEVA